MGNIELLPEGIFQPLADAANNLIDKLADAAGYITTPKGKRKDKQEATEHLIEEIKNNPKMSSLEKAAAISNVRKILKEYCNQADIVDIAMPYLNEHSDASLLDDDWIFNYMDKAAKISNKDVQLIFGRLLAEECNNPKSVSKLLINTLSLMDNQSASSFRKICKYIMLTTEDENGKEPTVIIPDVTNLGKYNILLTFTEIVDLTSLGFIEYTTAVGGCYCISGEVECTYGNFKLKLSAKDGTGVIPIGAVNLTRIGKELANIILSEPDSVYFEKIKEYWKEQNIEIGIQNEQ